MKEISKLKIILIKVIDIPIFKNVKSQVIIFTNKSIVTFFNTYCP